MFDEDPAPAIPEAPATASPTSVKPWSELTSHEFGQRFLEKAVESLSRTVLLERDGLLDPPD